MLSKVVKRAAEAHAGPRQEASLGVGLSAVLSKRLNLGGSQAPDHHARTANDTFHTAELHVCWKSRSRDKHEVRDFSLFIALTSCVPPPTLQLLCQLDPQNTERQPH